MSKFCRYCFNSVVDGNISPYNDLSYCGVGDTEDGYWICIRSGDGLPTAILFSKWDERIKRNIDVGIYEMKYCPECGRKLIENEKRFNHG